MVAIRPTAKPQKPSPIVLVRLEQEPALRGIVLSVGPEVRDIRPGQQVIFSRLQGFELELGEPVVLIREGAILATE